MTHREPAGEGAGGDVSGVDVRGTISLDELRARADQAARRIDAKRAEFDASREHTARREREAQAEPATGRQAGTLYDMEMEL